MGLVTWTADVPLTTYICLGGRRHCPRREKHRQQEIHQSCGGVGELEDSGHELERVWRTEEGPLGWTDSVTQVSDRGTMGPQPDLARHQGSRRLVANGVKCMSNYSELSTCREYGNIFPMSCTVFALQVPEVRTLKQSLETGLWLVKSVD